jgi:SNF2 family DNA or RNA helicase
MELIDNKAILLKVRNPDRFTSVIEHSAYLGEVSAGVHDLLVKWTFENVETLTDMGIKKVPSSILKDYTWTGRFTPMEHQKDTAGFIVNYKKCFIFLEQGLGKTASAAWAVDYLMKKSVVKRVLVVCPLSIMKAAWMRDLFSVVPHRSVGIAHGNQKTRRAILAGNYEFVIINFDGLEIVEKEIKQAKFDMVVVDEANGFKSTATRRWKTFNRIMVDIPRLVMMTGTPAAQSPEDAYGLAKLVSPHLVPTFVSGWKDLVMQKVSTFKWVPRPRANEIVHKVLQPAIRYTKEECLDLPDIMYATREVPLTVQQQKYYDTMRKQMLFEAAGEEVSAVNAAAKLTKLLQISTGNVYSDDGSVLQLDASNRLNELEAVIDESTHKVIVFAPFTHTINMIEAFLQKRGITCGVINGDVSANKRSMLFDSFQDTPDPRVLIIQPQAAAHGVTLTAANTIVWFGPTSSVETYLQANARAHRKGQVNKVTVIMLQGSPVEEKMYAMLNGKITSHSALVDMYKEIIHGT